MTATTDVVHKPSFCDTYRRHGYFFRDGDADHHHGRLLWRRVEFANTAHKMFFTWSLVYIAGSVPMHVYFGVIKGDVDFYLEFFPMWFSYLLLPFYAALLTMFWRLQCRN